MKLFSTLKGNLALLSLLSILLTSSCASVFSEMQSARTLGENKSEISGHFSSVAGTDNDDREHLQNQIGIQVAYGVTSNIDLRARYESIWTDKDAGDFHANVFAVGPKFSLVKNLLSGYIPVGFAFGKDIDIFDTWQTHPTLLGTIPVIDQLEVNPSFKLVIPLQKDTEISYAFNFGLGIKVFKGTTIRPEYGIYFARNEDTSFHHFSIGLTFIPSDVTNKD